MWTHRGTHTAKPILPPPCEGAALDAARRRYRLHPHAAYLRGLGYVFIDLDGRVLRMEETEFAAFQASCTAGVTPDAVKAFAGVLTECESANEALESFQRQELLTHGY